MNDNEILFQPKVEGGGTVKAGTKFEMNFSCPEDEQNSEANNILAEKDKEFIQNLKCCGNCRYLKISYIPPHCQCQINTKILIAPKGVCINWGWDCFTNDERCMGD